MMRRFGWRPDLPDFRDSKYSLIRRTPKVLPSRVDLREFCSPVEDQGSLGSCTANALAGALEYLENKDGVKMEDFSRLFIYYNERMIENTINEDSGAMIRTGIKSLAKFGACHEKLFPYYIQHFADQPSFEAYMQAKEHKVVEYHRIKGMYEMKCCLAEGYPFTFGFTVFKEFDLAEQTGYLVMPNRDNSSLGGHAVLAVGYDDIEGKVLVRNSYGKVWGQSGYFWMPYEYIDNPDLADDMWVIHRGEGI